MLALCTCMYVCFRLCTRVLAEGLYASIHLAYAMQNSKLRPDLIYFDSKADRLILLVSRMQEFERNQRFMESEIDLANSALAKVAPTFGAHVCTCTCGMYVCVCLSLSFSLSLSLSLSLARV